MNTFLIAVESLFFLVMFLTVVYLFVFALYSLRNRPRNYKQAKTERRIAIFFPAYKEDEVIMSAVDSMLRQDYPRDKYDIIVISDKMDVFTVRRLSEMPIKVFEVKFENSTKAKALNFALDSVAGSGYEIAVIMDADNTTDTDFLHRINNAYERGMRAIQAHRTAKNTDTDTAMLDALSEEVNNSIFRKGHINAGFSSALIGSGMAFDYKWFEKTMRNVSTVGEDKELEVALLRQHIYIDYLDDVMVYDEKTRTGASFYNQRRRWLSAQFSILKYSLRDLPQAIADHNIDYLNKMFQWMLLPRSVVLLVIILMSVLSLVVFNWAFALKWWGLFVVMLFVLSLATPDSMVDARFYKAMRKVPLLSMMMVFNLLRLRGAGKKFIHTKHSHKP